MKTAIDSSALRLLRALGAGATHAFIKRPGHRGCYMKVNICVLVVSCPHCSAGIGEPCIGTSKERITAAHYERMQEYQKQLKATDA